MLEQPDSEASLAARMKIPREMKSFPSFYVDEL
jgi:hypothetical protein